MTNLNKIITQHRRIIGILRESLKIIDRVRLLDCKGIEEEMQVLQQNIEFILNELRLSYKSLTVSEKYGQKVGSLKPQLQPFKLLPDVREFKIELQGEDPLFKKFGLKKNLKPRLTFTRYTNKKINRYVL